MQQHVCHHRNVARHIGLQELGRDRFARHRVGGQSHQQLAVFVLRRARRGAFASFDPGPAPFL
jgi:hypothetical protein